jgi:hypothetical protein
MVHTDVWRGRRIRRNGRVGFLANAVAWQKRHSDPNTESLHIGHAWIVAGTVAAIAFIGVMGPGLRLAL